MRYWPLPQPCLSGFRSEMSNRVLGSGAQSKLAGKGGCEQRFANNLKEWWGAVDTTCGIKGSGLIPH